LGVDISIGKIVIAAVTQDGDGMKLLSIWFDSSSTEYFFSSLNISLKKCRHEVNKAPFAVSFPNSWLIDKIFALTANCGQNLEDAIPSELENYLSYSIDEVVFDFYKIPSTGEKLE